MPEERIATVPPVAESEATGKVAEVYADIKSVKNIDFVPNFWRTLASYEKIVGSNHTLVISPMRSAAGRPIKRPKTGLARRAAPSAATASRTCISRSARCTRAWW